MASREQGTRQTSVHDTLRNIEERIEQGRVKYSEVPYRRVEELPTVTIDRRSQQVADRLGLLLDQCVEKKSAAPLGKW
ncbi:MAG: hypothetical protein PHQ80_00675 [Candidatus ainarchaeum sp.]|nr:hypothetical protein [Candidatus ainarchaeum sp.]MDD5096505.1 hypothetical protein [Candidatus ainarchaeum sp.]